MNQKYILKVVLLTFMGSAVLFAEPSVYGFTNSDTQHRVNSPEQIILNNKRTIASLQRKITQQNERIDGLTSIIEGLSASIAELRGERITNTSLGGGNDNTALLKELGVMIDRINDNYVSKEELQRALKGNYKPSVTNTVEKKIPQVQESKESLAEKSTSKLYSEGVRLFANKRYDEAKKRFDITDVEGYKSAASNYYLGEISYYTKKYEDAIFYFKKSAGLNDQTSYIDTLLLHTAISLEKSGDMGQASIFYENIIANYPAKRSAEIAKEKLKKL